MGKHRYSLSPHFKKGGDRFSRELTNRDDEKFAAPQMTAPQFLLEFGMLLEQRPGAGSFERIGNEGRRHSGRGRKKQMYMVRLNRQRMNSPAIRLRQPPQFRFRIGSDTASQHRFSIIRTPDEVVSKFIRGVFCVLLLHSGKDTINGDTLSSSAAWAA
jgi:hypothetical protein